jgi:hypothetical protein
MAKWHGMAWHGMAWHGEMTWHGEMVRAGRITVRYMNIFKRFLTIVHAQSAVAIEACPHVPET